MIAGLRAAATALFALALAWVAGGQALLDRIDPALALPTLMAAMLPLAWWQRREAMLRRLGTAAAALVLLVAAQAALAASLSGWVGGEQLLLILVAGAAAALCADALVQWRTPSRAANAILSVAVAAGWLVGGHALLALLYAPRPIVDAHPVVMLTGLPLRWANEGNLSLMVARGTADDPALARIEAGGPVALVDALAGHAPPAGATLLLAHPRALAPGDLVAVDAFVRGGGRAVILADALSGWPARHPLGDPRNPPVTSLLTPLLAHWGVALGAAPVGEQGARAVDVEGARLRLFSAGRFERLPAACRPFAGGRIAHCAIGAGEAWLVGDADLLFAPLWRPPFDGAAHLQRADTMAWLDRILRGAGAGRALLAPHWIRAD